VSRRHRGEEMKASVLIFMPGLAEIENLSEYITQFIKSDRIKSEF
jgi:HrpA-like RNA helicase